MSSADEEDVRQTQPPETLTHPIKPLHSDVERMKYYLGLFTSKDLIGDIFTKVMELPPEDRFTNSYQLMKELIQEEFGDEESLKSNYPWLADEGFLDRLNRLLQETVLETQRKVLQGIYFKRDAKEHLIVAVLVEKFGRSLYLAINNSDELNEEEINKAISCSLALGGRLYDLVESVDSEIDEEVVEENEKINNEVVMDIKRAEYYLSQISKEPSPESPEEREIGEIRREVIESGAVLAFELLDISVSRGAELADLSEDEFTDLLEQYGISSIYGPDSVEELYEDIDIDE